MQQVLLNLLKNAEEAKAERSEVGLIVESTQTGARASWSRIAAGG